MTKPKFKIGDRLFYKGHLHCVVMDIIQEKLSFTYVINMSINKKNKIVDEWDLFETKEKIFGKRTRKKQVSDKVKLFGEVDILREIEELKGLIIDLTHMVLKKNILEVERKLINPIKPIQVHSAENTINSLKVGQKKTFQNYSKEKIQEVLTSTINNKKKFSVINIGKKTQVYRYE